MTDAPPPPPDAPGPSHDEPPPPPRDEGGAACFPVVGIGASAGGVDAIETLFRKFGIDSMAFVVIEHMRADQVSHLPEMIARWTAMTVEPATDGRRLEPNHVYVVPPDCDLAVLDGALHVMPTPNEPRPHLPIDYAFRSLADDLGPYALGVVLSGTGTDGTAGLKAIKAAGGLTFAQRPSTARFDGMPRSAVEAGAADFVLAPDEIAGELMRVSHHPFMRRARTAARPVSTDRLKKVLVLVRDAFGHDLSQYKPGTIERRIDRRMAVHRIEQLDDYIKLLQSRPAELATLYHDLLIGVTSFFRDPEAFDALRTVVYPQLVEKRPAGAPIRVWVPGCSTGEEAYSIAMSLLEFLGERAHKYKLQVFATDVDNEAVQVARRGFYAAQLTTGLSPDRLQRFFVPKPGGFQVNRTIRDMVVFATQNVTKDPPFSRLDLVSCRNLLIYLQPPLQKKVLRIFHYALAHEGFLLLGTSESVGDSPDLFSLLDRRCKLYRKKNIPSHAAFEVNIGDSEGPARSSEHSPRAPSDPRPMANIQQLADRRVLDRYAPPGVLINEQFEVLQFRGRTGPYLEPLPGVASLNLLKLARPELVADVRAAVHRALETNSPVTVRGVGVKDGPEARKIDVEVLPVIEPESKARCLVVLFVEAAEADAQGTRGGEARSAEGGGAAPSTPQDARMQDLERELAANKQYLQATIEELETSNEELKSANEELQSTNEELETSKEELQSTNEELTTVNDELHSRMLELSQSNDDLQNLLGVTDTPVVMVGLDLRIRRFTLAAERLLNLIPSDVGRPVAHLSWFVPAGVLERMIGDVIQHLASRQEELAASNGRRYRVTAIPYKTSDHVIKGAVLTFGEPSAGAAAAPGAGAKGAEPTSEAARASGDGGGDGSGGSVQGG